MPMEPTEPIAIIGYGFRAPDGAHKDLYSYLASGKCAWSTIPRERFDQQAFYHPNPQKNGASSIKGGHFLKEDVFAFDAPFFKISPQEAKIMDPQHRLLLECAYEAIEQSGALLTDLAASNVGVFAAGSRSDYEQFLYRDPATMPTLAALGATATMFANRLSYCFDLKGPSVTIDTACSSSITAVHLACQSLRQGECSTAMVGASSLVLSPEWLMAMSTLGAMGSDGRCYSYDSRGSGYGRGEGAACILLKPLSAALEAGDPIRAVIRNSAINQDGHTQGITLPNGVAQTNLLRRLYAEAQLSPAETIFVEGHGTGTSAGDPIEANAIAEVFGADRKRDHPLYIGSVKSNFGHLENASGLLSMIKVILMLESGCILPNADFRSFNLEIASMGIVQIAQSAMPWPSSSPKIACLNNFGYGGSNASVIIEAAPSVIVNEKQIQSSAQKKTSGVQNQTNGINGVNGIHSSSNNSGALRPRLVVLSAKSQTTLKDQVKALKEWIEAHEHVHTSENLLDRLVYTLGERRTHYAHRWALAADSTQSLATALTNAQSGMAKSLPGRARIAFVFNGQGSQYPRMAVELHKYPIFANALSTSSKILKQFGASWDLKDELERAIDESRINEALISQPACTAIQIALVDLLKSWSVVPDVVTSHSSGEIAAAYATGALTLESALAVAYYRGIAAEAVRKSPWKSGAMLALGTGPLQAEDLLEDIDGGSGEAGIAAVNSPQSVTLSGDAAVIDAAHQAANELGLFARRLKVDVAYHSQHMTIAAKTYRESIAPYCKTAEANNKDALPAVEFYSSVTGSRKSVDTMDARYWVANLTSRVQFNAAMQALLQEGLKEPDAAKRPTIMLEIGPHGALKSPIQQIFKTMNSRPEEKLSTPKYHSILERGKPADECAVATAGFLFGCGLDVDIAAVNRGGSTEQTPKLLTDLPPYPWDKKTFSYVPRAVERFLRPKYRGNALLGYSTYEDTDLGHTFRNVFALNDLPWLRDHKVGGNVVFPFAGYLVMAVEALQIITPLDNTDAAIAVREMRIDRALWIPESETVELRLILRPCMTGPSTNSSKKWSFTISSCDGDSAWTQHTCGQVMFERSAMSYTSKQALELLEVPFLGQQEDVANAYDTFNAGSLEYGPSFRGMQQLRRISNSAAVSKNTVLDVMTGNKTTDDGLSIIHPATLDAFLHPLLCLLTDGSTPMRPHVPTFVSQLRIERGSYVDPGQQFQVAVQRSGAQKKLGGKVNASVVAFTQRSTSSLAVDPVINIEEITLTPIGDVRRLAAHESQAPESYNLEHFVLPDLLSKDQLESMLKQDMEAAADAEVGLAMQDQVALHFLSEVTGKLHKYAQDTDTPSHTRRFALWASRVLKESPRTGTPFSESLKDPQIRAQSLQAFESTSASSQMICQIGKNLPQILDRDVEPLDIMMQDGLLTRTYSEDVGLRTTYPAMAKYAALLSRTNPMLKVLEIGAGTGGATEHLLQAMSDDTCDPPRFLEYTYTDVTTGFFEQARNRFSRWSQQLKFAKFDVGDDPPKQGFEAASFDLIVAANVLHATPNLHSTLKNVRLLLKPGGKLLLQELTRPRPRFLPFSTLPGWWLSEDEFRSEEGPLLSVDSWETALRQSGFSGVESCTYDFPGTEQQSSAVITSSRNHDPERTVEADVSVCTFHPIKGGTTVSEFVETLQRTIHDGTSVSKVSSSTAEIVQHSVQPSSIVVIVDDPAESIFSRLTAPDLSTIKIICAQARKVLWIAPSSSYPCASPESHMCEGLLRTLNAEGAAQSAITVQLSSYSQATAISVADILSYTLKLSDAVGEELEYLIGSDGAVRVPRLIRSQNALDAFNIELDVPTKQQQPLWQPDRPLELVIDEGGGLDSLHWSDSQNMKQRIGENDIVVRTMASGLNFVDLFRVLGQVDWKNGIGLEGAGIVEQVGQNVVQHRPGDRVCYMNFGGAFATHNIVPAMMAVRVPDGVELADAATRPVTLCTAVLALEDLARIQHGESVLVHAATGGVGQFAVQVAQYYGATVYATAGTKEKRKYLHEEFGIPKTHIFSSRDADFADRILELTNGQSVDIVLNSLAGELLQKSWSVVAEFGRFVEIGKKDLLNNGFLEMRKSLKNAAFFGLYMDDMSLSRPGLVGKALERAMEMLRLGIVQPARPLSQYQAPDVKEGFRKLQLGKNMGKIAFILGEDDMITVRYRKPFSDHGEKLFRANASYIITGGTGGLGRSIVPWMVQNGARYIFLLSRSGSLDKRLASVCQDAATAGATVKTVACDVSDLEQLARVLKDARDVAPVAGVIHGALVLKDALFANANHAEWQSICAPKVQGAWNLHRLLEHDNLDFFVSLASLTGVLVNVGQAVYAATTSFLESFARYRRRLGLPAVTIDLSGITEVGYAAEKGYEEGTRNLAGSSLNESQFHIVLKGAIMGDSSALSDNGVNMSGIKVLPSSLDGLGSGAQTWARSARARYLLRAAWAEAAAQEDDAGGDSRPSQQPLADRLAQASSDADVIRLLTEGLANKVSSIMMIGRDDITVERPMTEYGLDSLVSVELRNWIRHETNADLPLATILGSANLGTLAQEISRRRSKASS